MENNKSLLEDLIKRIEEYAKTTIELYKLKTVKQFTESTSALTVRFFVFLALITFFFVLSIGFALWIGELLGKIYYGFFVVAGGYLLLAIIIRYIVRKPTKRWVANVLVRHILK